MAFFEYYPLVNHQEHSNGAQYLLDINFYMSDYGQLAYSFKIDCSQAKT